VRAGLLVRHLLLLLVRRAQCAVLINKTAREPEIFLPRCVFAEAVRCSPVTGLRNRLGSSAAVGRSSEPEPTLAELAWTASIVTLAFLIAVSVYAYGVGGEKAVGLIFLARLIPAALVAPFAGMLGDRYPRERVLLLTNVARVILVGAAALAVFLDADPWVVYALSIAATIATTPFRSSGGTHANLARTRSSPQRTRSRAEWRASPSSPALRLPACCSEWPARGSSSRSRRCSSSRQRSSFSSSAWSEWNNRAESWRRRPSRRRGWQGSRYSEEARPA
jgi:hypothetical protein